LCRRQGGMVFAFLILFLMRRSWLASVRDLLTYWLVLVPALAGLSIYALVHVEYRYVSSFVVLGWAAVLAGVRLPGSSASKTIIHYVSVTSLAAMLLTIGAGALPAVRQTAVDLRLRTDAAPHRQWQVADQLLEMGLRPGDKVAHVGQALKSWSYWARLAGVRIIAELRPDDSFWLADDATRARVMEAFASTGARAVIARRRATDERPFRLPVDFAPGWQPVGKTGHYVHFLAD